MIGNLIFLLVLISIAIAVYAEARGRLKRGRGGPTTKQGRRLIIWSVVIFGIFGLIFYNVVRYYLNDFSGSLSELNPYLLIIPGLVVLFTLFFFVSRKLLIEGWKWSDYAQKLFKINNSKSVKDKVPNKSPNLSLFAKRLDKYFTLEEFKGICFDLGVDYENLIEKSKIGKMRELVSLMHRRDRLHELIEICETESPNASWRDFLP